jgi:hypothetical protein
MNSSDDYGKRLSNQVYLTHYQAPDFTIELIGAWFSE